MFHLNNSVKAELRNSRKTQQQLLRALHLLQPNAGSARCENASRALGELACMLQPSRAIRYPDSYQQDISYFVACEVEFGTSLPACSFLINPPIKPPIPHF